jgi:molecular chaperone Hsp33
LDDLDLKPLQQITPVLNRDCCSEERLFRAIRLLPKEEIDKILEDQDQLEARCDFCGTVYRMSPDEVEERFATATGDPSLDEDFYKS